MKHTLKISHTAFPNGGMVKYMNGMQQPEIKDLSQLMKDAVWKALFEEKADKIARLQIEKHIQIAG